MPDQALPPSALRDHMAKYSGEIYVEGWAELWNNKQENETLSWDRGCHSVALEDILTRWRELDEGVFAKQPTGRRRRALVPGCGTGYDVLLLASFGFDVYGLDYSRTAVEYAKRYAAENGDKYPVQDAELGRGKVVYVEGDYFKDDWLKGLGLPDSSFDLIYDYTVSFVIFMRRTLQISMTDLSMLVFLRSATMATTAMGDETSTTACTRTDWISNLS
jgi:SAM-dependent methyltransferase